jgi:nucleotide-binding universal stress UspA family protein
LVACSTGADAELKPRGVIMFETIVWATDASALSDSGLALVTELAQIHRSKIIALHVDERFPGGSFAGGPMLVDEDGIRRRVEWQVEELREAGFEAELEIAVTRKHNPAAAIAGSAAGVGADLIVVSTRGSAAFETLVHPSVARGLTHAAHCPVLVIPPGSSPSATDPVPVAAGRGHRGPGSPTQVESL